MMSFEEIINSEFYPIVEAIEHGSSDNQNIIAMVKLLKEKTGYEYIINF